MEMKNTDLLQVHVGHMGKYGIQNHFFATRNHILFYSTTGAMYK